METKTAHEFNSVLERGAVPFTHVALTLPHEPTTFALSPSIEASSRPGTAHVLLQSSLPPRSGSLTACTNDGTWSNLASISRHASTPRWKPIDFRSFMDVERP